MSAQVRAASPVMYSFFNLSVRAAVTATVPVVVVPLMAAAISGVIKEPALIGPKLTCI